MSSRLVSVLLPRLLDAPLTYGVPAGMALAPGDFVLAPLGRGQAVGVAWDDAPERPQAEIKTLAARLDLAPMAAPLRRFLDRFAAYNLAPRGMALKLAMPPDAVIEPVGPRARQYDFGQPDGARPGPSLSQAQQAAAHSLRDEVRAAEFSVSLLEGVTGSGKTEVYFEAMAEAFSRGQQVLTLLPEIALTSQWLERFAARFGVEPVLWHSQISPARRRESWRAIADGRARAVVGARSALFLPFQNLGLVVVDEEHDGSYKQEDGVIYNARDMAVLRAQSESRPVLLASATPSLETRLNAQEGRYKHFLLPERHRAAPMPDIRLVDMRAEKLPAQNFLSTALRHAMAERLAADEQTLLFLNRRGYAPLTLCNACGHRLECPHCSAWLVAHKTPRGDLALRCHHCGFSGRMPDECPACTAEASFKPCGPGVERLEDETRAAFPDARIGLLTSDTSQSLDHTRALVAAMQAGEIDILIGTQMAAKGYHFSRLTLVGVVDADLGLGGGDLRAAERTWQLLMQVTGRAGRADRPGLALLQTYEPGHPVMQAIQSQDAARFYAVEAEGRRLAGMPPFGRLASVMLSARNAQAVQEAARLLAASAPDWQGVTLLGPAPPPLAMLRGQHRLRFLVKADRRHDMARILREWRARVALPRAVTLRFDVDPYNFL